MTTKTAEKVLAVTRLALDGAFTTGPFARMTKQEMLLLFYSRFCADRARLETDRRYKQIITYVLIRRKDSLLCYERRGSENRLTGLLSIGIGGHVNPHESIPGAALRELSEEVKGLRFGSAPIQFAGLVNENETEVGKVHVGVVYTLDVPENMELESNETALRNVRFEPVTDLYAKRDDMELWSRICLEHLTNIF
jgi:predicted NUDIX family phosphoesterase